MKIGILTYHNTRNCGALLQAYALQKKLFELGIDNEIIDYRCDKIEETYRLKKIYELKGIKQLAKWFLTIGRDKRTQKKFDEFKRENLKLSGKYDKASICKANLIYDAFITGSDQVWNAMINGDDLTYLLDFAGAEKKKYSYAASIGGGEPKVSYAEKMQTALADFDFISVRENPLAEYIKTDLGLDTQMVLDPTLLLDGDDYIFASEWKKPKTKYIFVYTIATTPNIESAAKKLSKETGLPIIWGHMSYRKRRGVKNVTDLSPCEFVNYIKNAEYVFTSSFHGMAMSIVLHKQFFYDLDDNVQNNNSRLETLAESLGLQSRELLKLSDASFLTNMPLIDYKQVESALEIRRRQSVCFLEKF